MHKAEPYATGEKESGGAEAGGGHAREAGIDGCAQAGKAAQILFVRG